MPRWFPSPGEHATHPTQVTQPLQKIGPAATPQLPVWRGQPTRGGRQRLQASAGRGPVSFLLSQQACPAGEPKGVGLSPAGRRVHPGGENPGAAVGYQHSLAMHTPLPPVEPTSVQLRALGYCP